MMTIDDSKSCTFSVIETEEKILRFTVHPVVTWQSGLCATLDFLVDQWCWSGWDSIEFSFRISFDSAMCFFFFSCHFSVLYRMFLCYWAIVAQQQAVRWQCFVFSCVTPRGEQIVHYSATIGGVFFCNTVTTGERNRINQDCVCKHWMRIRDDFLCDDICRSAAMRSVVPLSVIRECWSIHSLFFCICRQYQYFEASLYPRWDVNWMIKSSWNSFYCCFFGPRLVCSASFVDAMMYFFDIVQQNIYYLCLHSAHTTKLISQEKDGTLQNRDSEEDVKYEWNFLWFRKSLFHFLTKAAYVHKNISFSIFPLCEAQKMAHSNSSSSSSSQM